LLAGFLESQDDGLDLRTYGGILVRSHPSLIPKIRDLDQPLEWDVGNFDEDAKRPVPRDTDP
jgi:hypothetical protein